MDHGWCTFYFGLFTFSLFWIFVLDNVPFLLVRLNCVGLQTKWSCFKKPFNFEKPLPSSTTSKLVLRSLLVFLLHPHGMAYITYYNKHFVLCCQCLHFKPIQRSLIVEWCFECNLIHEHKVEGKNEPFLL